MQPQPPLSDRELRILRGMLDEYEYERRRRSEFLSHLSVVEKMIVAVAAVVPTLDVILRLTGH